jgi:hypothetical protein
MPLFIRYDNRSTRGMSAIHMGYLAQGIVVPKLTFQLWHVSNNRAFTNAEHMAKSVQELEQRMTPMLRLIDACTDEDS